MSTPAPARSPGGRPWPLLAVPLALIAFIAVGSSHVDASTTAPLIVIASAIMLAVMIHIGTIALVGARLFGWRTHSIAFGTGPVWLRTAAGDVDVTFGAMFFAGGVGVDDPSVIRGWRGALGEVSGCLVLIVVAAALIGDADVIASVPTIWKAIVAGALSPLSEAQVLLASAGAQLKTADALSRVGLVFLVLGAFNLLPIPVLNGGNAIMSLVLDRDSPLAATVFKIGLLALLLMVASWILALVGFVWRALA